MSSESNTTSDSGGSSSSPPPPPSHTRMPRKSGHLYKRTGVVRSWKPLYFSLEGTVLYYFKREGDSQPKGIVVLTGCTITPTKDKKYYSFRIAHPHTSKVYDLAATLQSRTQDWIDALIDATQLVTNSSTIPQRTRSESTSSTTSRRASAVLTHSSSSSSLTHSFGSFDAAELDAIRVDNDPHVTLPEQYRARLEALMGEFVHQAREDASGWHLQTEQRDVKAYVRTASKLGSFKGVGVIHQHPYAVLQLILEISRRHLFDPQLLTKQRVHVYDQHTFIDHLVYKAVFPTSPRDFVNITHWRVLSDGSILVIAASVDREDLCPKREPKIVRANAIMGGFLLVPSDDYTSVKATYIIKADMKSGIPQTMQTKLFIKQAFVIDGIRKALEEDDGEENDEEEDASKTHDYPRVTNSTHFALSVTDPEQDRETSYDNDDRESGHSTERDHENDDHASTVNSDHGYGVPTVPAEFKDLVDKALARMDSELNDESAWHFHSEKHGVKAFTKVDGALTASKGVGFLPFHPRAIFNIAIDSSCRKTVDPQLAFGGPLKRLDPHTCIDYFEYKPVFVVAGRDFCNVGHWRVLPNGTIVIVAQSIEDFSLCPSKEPKVVRGEVHLGCWKIVPNAEYTGAEVSFMVKSDLKGSIPSRIAGKVAAEQPYILLRIAEALKKKKNFSEVVALGKVKNVGAGGVVPAPLRPASSRSTSTATSRKNSSSSLTKLDTATAAKSSTGSKTHSKSVSFEPEAEASLAGTSSNSEVGHEDQHDTKKHIAAPSAKNTPEVFATTAAQFVVAILALKSVGLPQTLHYGVILALIGWFALQLHLGPSHMTPRRKLMIATFGPPDSGMILGTLEIDVSETKKYIGAKREASGDHITITHIVLRALGVALGKSPTVNGHIVFGNYYPAPTVDISCLVAVDGGKDLGVSRLPSADQMDLKTICNRLRGDASKLRSGKDKEQEDRNQLLRILPTYVIRPVTNLIGWLGGAVGMRIKPVGVEKYMFGSCMVTSVGMMGLDLAFAPLTPYSQVPMLITVGSIKDKAVVVDGQIAIRPMLTITTTIDHRYVDGSEAARMASNVKKYIEDPAILEPVTA